jgi:hypothetical protein
LFAAKDYVRLANVAMAEWVAVGGGALWGASSFAQFFDKQESFMKVQPHYRTIL